jgi:cyclopropane fatty-acyl-phospholipid synthase-like methyltransferase
MPGCGGGELVREATDKEGNVKYDSVTGAKDYRWLEAEMVKALGKEKDIDLSYYNKLVDDAVEAISTYGDFEYFVSDDPWDDLPFTMSDMRPPWEGPDEPWNDEAAELFMKR